MPGLWEFNYLASELTWTGDPPVASDGDYLKYFRGGAGYRRVGEKSAFYLFSRTASGRIKNLSPDAKIICMLRDPVGLLFSLFRYNVANLEDDIFSFELALAAEIDRRAGKRIPTTGTIVQNLYYREIVRFSEQLQRYFDVFGRGQVLVVIFDDLVTNPEQVYAEILDFLEVRRFALKSYANYNAGDQDLSYVGVRRFLHKHSRLKIGRAHV